MTRLVPVLAAVLALPLLLAPALLLAPSAAQAAPPTGKLAAEIMKAGEALPAAQHGRGYVAVPAEAFTSEAAAEISPIIYLNRCRGGCMFTKSSQSDAISNQTIIGGVSAGTRMTVTEFGYDESVWNATLACIRSVYQPFGVQVVTDDPGNTAHHEAVLAGRAIDMNIVGALGIAPLNSSTCQPQNNVISFSFANDHGPSPLDMCWTVAQESAHAFGLDHEFECSDALTYIPISGQCPGAKMFRNVDAKCGENTARPCLCTGPTQNSYKRLLAVHGPGTVPVAAPVTNIVMPADGASNLPRTFSVFPTAVDPRGLNHLELLVNGWKWAEVPGLWQKTTIYVMDLPARIPDGVMDIKVRGCGDTGVCGEDQITVTRGAACTSAAACLDGQRCEAGKCFWDPPSVDFYGACTFNEACLSNTCADIGGGELVCTEACVSGPNDRCTEGYECNGASLGAAGVCVVASTDDGSCCSTGAARGTLLFNLGLASVIGLMATRRRRRRI